MVRQPGHASLVGRHLAQRGLRYLDHAAHPAATRTQLRYRAKSGPQHPARRRLRRERWSARGTPAHRRAGDIIHAFDDITYVKGGAVIRMMEAWLGAGQVQQGIRSYLERHRHGVAVSAISSASWSESRGDRCARPSRPSWIAPAFPWSTSAGSGKGGACSSTWRKHDTCQGDPRPRCQRPHHASALRPIRPGRGRGTTLHRSRQSRSGGELAGGKLADLALPERRRDELRRLAPAGERSAGPRSTHRQKLRPAERVALPFHLRSLLKAEALSPGAFLEGTQALGADDHPRCCAP